MITRFLSGFFDQDKGVGLADLFLMIILGSLILTKMVDNLPNTWSNAIVSHKANC